MGPFLLLGALVVSAADAGLPPPRALLGTCLGVDGPLSVVATAAPTARETELSWDLAITTLKAAQAPVSRRATASAPRAYDGVPASAELSWTVLDDATQRLWAPGLSMLVAPSARFPLSPLSVEGVRGPCEGAAFASAGALDRTVAGAFWLILIIPGESVALGVLPDGTVSTIPLVQVPPGKGRGARKSPAAAPPTALALDQRVRLERVDVKQDKASQKTVGGAWRITLMPSRTVGQLTSTSVAFPTQGAALHQVSGGLMLKGGRGEVSGVLLEGLP